MIVEKFFPLIKQNFIEYEEFLNRKKPVTDETVDSGLARPEWRPSF
jgi:hypothetical protein